MGYSTVFLQLLTKVSKDGVHAVRHTEEAGPGTVSRRGIVATSAVIGAGAFGAAAGNTQTAQAAPKSRSNAGGRILVNNVGYETRGSKRALVAGIRTAGRRFDIIDADTGNSVHHGTLSPGGGVKDWGNTRYLVADFTGFDKTGHYLIKVGQETSTLFRIEDDLLERRTASDVIHYFKGSRCTGQFDKRDKAIPTKDHPHARHDVHGGWYDATGDFGKHPWLHRTAWMLFKCYDQLTARHNANFTQLRTWMLDEAMFGADYLVRIHPKKGTFYEGVSQPGPPKDPKRRTLDTNQVTYGDNSGYGGGLGAGYAIAALALASTYDVTGEYNTGDYIRCAEEAWEALEDEKLAGDIRTLTDALTAATELFRATGKQPYREKAADVSKQLVDRLGSWKKYQNYWTEDDDGTPYQDGTDGGHPVVALLSYHDIAPHADRADIRDQPLRRVHAGRLRPQHPAIRLAGVVAVPAVCRWHLQRHHRPPRRRIGYRVEPGLCGHRQG